jgi:hypothetical protein
VCRVCASRAYPGAYLDSEAVTKREPPNKKPWPRDDAISCDHPGCHETFRSPADYADHWREVHNQPPQLPEGATFRVDDEGEAKS